MEIRKTLGASPAAASEARALVDAFADLMPASAHQDLRIVVTELVANSTKFGRGCWIGVRLHTDGKVIRGEISDAGKGGAEIDWERPPAEGGIGLKIVDTLCSAWGNPPGTGRVWFTLDLAGS